MSIFSATQNALSLASDATREYDKSDSELLSEMVKEGHTVVPVSVPPQMVIKQKSEIEVSQGESELNITSQQIMLLKEEYQMKLIQLKTRNEIRIEESNQRHDLAIRRIYAKHQEDMVRIQNEAQKKLQALAKKTQENITALYQEHERDVVTVEGTYTHKNPFLEESLRYQYEKHNHKIQTTAKAEEQLRSDDESRNREQRYRDANNQHEMEIGRRREENDRRMTELEKLAKPTSFEAIRGRRR